jgi:creatinine amidohydrolase
MMDLNRDQLASLVDEHTIGVLPIAAIEPHGPHLPFSTDVDIAEGHIATLLEREVAQDVLILPTQMIGASEEHDPIVGTLSFDNKNLFENWHQIAERFSSWGGRRLIVVSSHGGNSAIVDQLILALRQDFEMLAVSTSWLRFGQPAGLFSDEEIKLGIHGGDIETSLMLHYQPSKVDMERAQNFANQLPDITSGMTHLSGFGKHRFGWLSHDLNIEGVVGDAAAASAEKGAKSAQHAVDGFCELLADVAQFDLNLFDDKF